MRTSDKVSVLVEPKCSECFVVVNEDDECDEGGDYLLSPAYPQAMPGSSDTMTHEVSWAQGLSSVSALTTTGCGALLPHPLWSSPPEPDPKAQNREPPRPTSAGMGPGWCWLLKALLPSGSCHQGAVLLGLGPPALNR